MKICVCAVLVVFMLLLDKALVRLERVEASEIELAACTINTHRFWIIECGWD